MILFFAVFDFNSCMAFNENSILASVEKAIVREEKRARSGDKDAQKLVELCKKILPHLNEGKPVRSFGLDADELAMLKPLFLLTAKPAMYVGNVAEDGFENTLCHVQRQIA